MLSDFIGNDNYGRPKKEYLDSNAKRTDKELYAETRRMIWLSAYANNNPRSDYHWMVDALYAEWSENRKNPDGYKKAYEDEYKANFG